MVDITKVLTQKEFYSLRYIDTPDTPLPTGFIDYEHLQQSFQDILKLQGHQIFIKNLFEPHTKYKRLLLYHSTGTGKTLVILSIAQMYIEYFKKMRQQPQVIILGFTEDIITKELMKFTDFGYITTEEQATLIKLRKSNVESDKLRRRGMQANIKRRITDKSRGGYYEFYGYQKFANDLFIITSKGLENKISHNDIYESEINFDQRIDELISKGYIIVNRSLLESLKYSFIACDEIHNVYNVKSKNNRGMAIQYALDTLEKEDPTTSPRVIFASATPLSGSPVEIVNVVNLLIPNSNITKSDFFESDGKIKTNTLDKIGRMCAGYVSFLKDTNVDLYPKRIFEGYTLFNIPYLKLTPCPMSKFHQSTLSTIKDIDEIESLLTTGAYTLYDMVFPNPDDNKVGLFNTQKINGSISTASDEWKDKIGIEIVKNVPTGSFLEYDNIGKYSTKYKVLLDEVIDILDRKEPGKILIYHFYVSGSGVNLLRELFLRNGFIDGTSAPISTTRCSVCGVINKNHSKIKDHPYKPARVLVVYGDMGSDVDKNIVLYNNRDNSYGYEYRIMIGSRVIQEGKDFNCIRFLFSLSLPRDISTLIQLYGRGVRAKSHFLLPPEYRNVKIYNLVSTFSDESLISPELLNYKRKMDIYVQIQLVERELRRYAIDNFINYNKMKLPNKPTLDGLPYDPVYKFNPSKVDDSCLTTFQAYGYDNIEVDVIIVYLKRLFMYRPVWTQEDLWKEVRNPSALYKTAYDQKTFSEDNFILSLDFLVNGTYVQLSDNLNPNENTKIPYILIGNEIRRVIYQPPFYILTAVDELGIPVIDYDLFMRVDTTQIDIEIPISNYAERAENIVNFDKYYTMYIEKYKGNPVLSLVKINQRFHLTICKSIVEGQKLKNVNELVDTYYDLGLIITGNDFHSDEVSMSYGITNKDKTIGFINGDMSYIYTNKKWSTIPSSLIKTSRRLENEDVVGYTKQSSSDIVFKIRNSITSKTYKNFTDKRKVEKGTVCETIDMGRKRKIAQMLKINETLSGRTICSAILNKLLKNEVNDRHKPKGQRWFYFFWEVMPIS